MFSQSLLALTCFLINFSFECVDAEFVSSRRRTWAMSCAAFIIRGVTEVESGEITRKTKREKPN